MRHFGIIFLFLLSVAVIIQSCNTKDPKTSKVTINGTFVMSRAEMLYLYEINVYEKSPLDSTKISSDGSFTFTIEIDDASFLWLGTKDDNYITLLVEGEESITIEGDLRSLPATYSIKGSPGSEQLYILHRHTLNNYAKLDSLALIWEKRMYNNDKLELQDSLDSVAKTIYEEQERFVTNFIKQNSSSLASIIALYQTFGRVPILDEFEHLELFRSTATSLKEKYPDNQHVNELLARVEKNTLIAKENEEIKKRLQPGNPVPELSLPNMNGEPVSINDYKGYTILIYFWSSVSPESRKMNQQLISTYKLFAPRGFILFNVSLDNNPEIWKQAVGLDKMPGIHVCDFMDWASPVVKIFNIQEIPYNVLVDKEGLIVANGLTIEQLNQKLYELLPQRTVGTPE